MTPLRRRMIEDMQIRNLSPQTQSAYVEQVARFARHFRQIAGTSRASRDPDLADLPGRGQSVWRPVRSSVAVAALRFFYTVTLKRPWVVEDDIPTGRQAEESFPSC